MSGSSKITINSTKPKKMKKDGSRLGTKTLFQAPDMAIYRLPGEEEPLEGEEKRPSFIQETFIREYFKDHNLRNASARAGIAYDRARFLIQEPHIRKRMDEIQKEINQELTIEARDVINYLGILLKADINDIFELRQGCCRHCWGYDNKTGRINHEYQFRTKNERIQARKEHGLRDGNGGLGYNSNRIPNPACPYCDGLGIQVQVFKDTRSLNKSHYLIKNFEVDCKGKIRVEFHDRLVILDFLAKHFGLFEKDNKQQAEKKLVIEGGFSEETLKKLRDPTLVEQLEDQLQKELQSMVDGQSSEK